MDALLTERSRRIMGLAHEEFASVPRIPRHPAHPFGYYPQVHRPVAEALRSLMSPRSNPVGFEDRWDRTRTGAPDDRGVSPRARRVLGFAHEEAKRCGQPLVDAEHLLLGMTRETHGVAAQVLRDLGADPAAVRERVSGLLDRGDVGTQ